MSDEGPDNNLDEYLALIDRYLAGDLPAGPFSNALIALYKKRFHMPNRASTEILSTMFLDCDEYEDDPRLRTGGPYEIDGPELHCRIVAARQKLRELWGH